MHSHAIRHQHRHHHFESPIQRHLDRLEVAEEKVGEEIVDNVNEVVAVEAGNNVGAALEKRRYGMVHVVQKGKWTRKNYGNCIVAM
jgi:hypothetical protein